MSNQWQAASVTLQISMAIKVLILLLESQNKTQLLNQTGMRLSPEETTNVFNRRLFWWLNRLFRKGYRRSLALPDLYVLDQELSSKTLGLRLQETWNRRRKNSSKYSLAFSLWESFAWAIAAPVLPRLLLTGFTFAQPFLVQAVTTFLQESQDSAPTIWGYGLIGAYFFAYSGIALSNGWYWHKQYRLITMVRGSLVSAIYSKTLRMGAGAVTGSEATTLMSADVERIVVGLRSLHEIWGGMLDLGLALWLLYHQVGLAMLSMAGMALVCTLGASKLAQCATARQKLWMESMQNRLTDTVKAIGSLKSIKMLGFEDKLSLLIQNLRQGELDAMVHFRVATTCIVTLAHVSLFMNSVVLLSAFLPIANQYHLLYNTQRIFNTLTLVTLIGEPFQSFLQAIPAFAMAIGCISRIQAYLLTADHYDPRRHLENNSASIEIPDNPDIQSRNKKQVNAFVVRNGDFGWVEGSPAVLQHVNVNIPAGKLTLVVGLVGSGKTTLLHALLGETVQIKGEVLCLRQSIAFCAQQPWLTNTTARKSIIGHSEEDSLWYERVIEACALDRDFLELEKGDQTIVGSAGAALSGGQKQRIALARAVYSRKSVILIDDVLSGLDRRTEKFVFNALFGADGLFRTSLPHTTVVLATHAVRHLKYADHIVALLPNGRGSIDGTLTELSSLGHGLQNPKLEKEEEELSEDSEERKRPSISKTAENPAGSIFESSSDEVNIISEKNIIWFYMSSMGFWNNIAFLAMGVVTVGLWKTSEYWARLWAEHNEAHPTDPRASYYLGIYALMNGVAVTVAGHWLMIVVPKTGLSLHERVLRTVLNATYPFLSRADTGGLATRFGQDLLIVDVELPNAFANTIFLLLTLIAQLALVASASFYMLAAFPVLFIAIYAVQRVYLRTSRRIRHLDLETKAPLYAQFTDALKGAASIRAFGWRDSSMEENNTLLDENQRPFYLLFCVQRWLECVLDYTVAGLAVVVVGVAVATRTHVGGAQMGLALLNLVSLGETMKSLVKYWTMMETSIAAVSRIRNFTETTPQEMQPLGESGETQPMLNANGGMAITLTDVSASYLINGSNVLSNLSLDIAPGEKIAICGRSGSGKSSVLNALLKMIHTTGGSLQIGHTSSLAFGAQQLRHNLNTIPQDSYFFPGTVRQNLDPDSVTTDGAMIAAITRVGLEGEVTRCGGLGGDLVIEGFSAGQLQLLSLARAILRKKGVLLLDEATSSVDQETDRKMHDIIFEDFADQTVIAILHRREELYRFDRVVVVDRGRIVSSGKPGLARLDM
ncbi:hypothetical protein G7Y89_g3952 [Cudoniella acicularis]|uniref:Uncharacterized protein n=1 Tax=Cudoniella acicularis TaxID=354080 RepID=A0A8H4RQE4_9HELO|nr:hypothetical protein G7Y89_g3952 [Cudoniella acicularis]